MVIRALVVFVVMAAPLSFAAENCKRGEYYFNAFKNSGNLPASDAVAMLERAVEACSRWCDRELRSDVASSSAKEDATQGRSDDDAVRRDSSQDEKGRGVGLRS